MRAAAALVLILAACYGPHPALGLPCSAAGTCPDGQFCDLTLTPPICLSALPDGDAAVPPDAFTGCMDSSDCMAATAPVCDPTTHACRGCVADVECGSVCTEYNGQCLPDPKAIFVSTTGTDAGNCTRNSPCRSFGYAFSQLSTMRRTIVPENGTYSSSGSPVLSISDTGGRIVVSGADLDPAGVDMTATSNGTTNPQVVNVGGNTDVVIEGITIKNGGQDGIRNFADLLLSHVDVTGNAGRGVLSNPTSMNALHIWDCGITNNSNEGINAQKGPVEILRSIIARNTNGGLFVGQSSSTTVSGCMIVSNGTPSSSYGGMRLQNPTGTQTFALDTIAYNLAGGTTTYSGIQSDTSVALSSCILANNNNVATDVDQISPTITASYSLFTTTPPIGAGNQMGDPLFVDPTTDDFHLQTSSPAKDAGDPASTARFDLDGTPRPSGAGFEIGADELP